MNEFPVENTRDDGAQAENPFIDTGGGYYRSQEEVDAAFKKRMERERRKWEEENPRAFDSNAGEPQELENTGPDAENENKYGEMLDDIARQADELLEIYPDFDFPRELEQKPMFAYMLAEGMDLKSVYEYFYPEKAMERVREDIRTEVIENIRARNARPQGIRYQNGAGGVRDVSLLTDAQIEDIDRRVKRGERVML